MTLRREQNGGPSLSIAFIIDEIHGATAGTESQLLETIGRLDRLAFTPYIVVLRSTPFLRQGSIPCEVKILDLARVASLGGLIKTIALSRWMRTMRVDIAQTFFKDANAVGLVAAWIARVPLRVSSRRNMKYDASRGDMIRYRLLDRLVDYYLVNGHAIEYDLIATERVEPNRIHVFHNFVSQKIESIRRSRPTTTSHINILFVANIRPVKGHAFFFKAITAVLSANSGVRVICVGGDEQGGDPRNTHFFKQVSESGFRDRFDFVGLQHDVTAYLLDADIGVLCSSSEGFSSSLLEYLAAGLPCVATDVGCNKELVFHEHNGYVVPYGDVEALTRSLQTLCADLDLRARMGARSREIFEERFGAEKEIRRMERFWTEHARPNARRPLRWG